MPPVTTHPVTGIERGTVFLHAHWSGSSVLALQHLRRAWTAAALPESELHVLDWDEHSSLGELPELCGRVHGYGEAFHVRRGAITHFHVLGRDPKTVDDEVRAFLQAAGNA